MTTVLSKRARKLKTLLAAEGFPTLEAFLESTVTDSVCPGICMNEGCDLTCEVEPDQTRGWCEACDAGAVASGLVLAGLI